MAVQDFKHALDNLKTGLASAIAQELDLESSVDPVKAMYSFKEKRLGQFIKSLESSVASVRKHSSGLAELNNHDISNSTAVNSILVNVKFLEEYWNRPEKALPIVEDIERSLRTLKMPEEMKRVSVDVRVPALPGDIRDEVSADVAEMKKCYDAGCYRSCVILCGRILETALHRKYFEITGNDILEKNPGIGLGTLIAKLKEKDVAFDPGLTQQIHLINQARIFSVHKKQEPFKPSQAQAQAIMLYTMDIMWKMF